MSQDISLSVRYPSNKYPAGTLLKSVFKAGLNRFFKPKMGTINLNGNILECGIPYPGRSLLDGERFYIPGITEIPGFSDATGKVLDFVNKFPGQPLWLADFCGEILLEYAEGGKVNQGWFYRHGFPDDLYNISCFDVNQPSNGPQSSTFMFIIVAPWFFLKEWQLPDNWLPNYATPETSEHNWNQVINLFQSVINILGSDDLEQTSLRFDGSGPRGESEWLIDRARKLPKLEVNFA